MQITHFISIVGLNGISPHTTPGNVVDPHYNEVIQVLVKLPASICPQLHTSGPRKSILSGARGALCREHKASCSPGCRIRKNAWAYQQA